MINLIKINGEWLPTPDDDPQITPEKVKTEKETEAGTTVVQVTRPTKLTISGNWTLSGEWARKFRAWREEDTVTVEIYYPDPRNLKAYTCQFEITSDKEVRGARKQLVAAGGIYQISVEMTEI